MRRWLPRTRPIGAELQLDVGKIIETVTELRSRIEERFPGSGLGSLADPVVLAVVDEVEALTTGLSSKIWQKLMILDWSLNAAREEEGYRG